MFIFAEVDPNALKYTQKKYLVSKKDKTIIARESITKFCNTSFFIFFAHYESNRLERTRKIILVNFQCIWAFPRYRHAEPLNKYLRA